MFTKSYFNYDSEIYFNKNILNLIYEFEICCNLRKEKLIPAIWKTITIFIHYNQIITTSIDKNKHTTATVLIKAKVHVPSPAEGRVGANESGTDPGPLIRAVSVT